MYLIIYILLFFIIYILLYYNYYIIHICSNYHLPISVRNINHYLINIEYSRKNENIAVEHSVEKYNNCLHLLLCRVIVTISLHSS